MICHSRWMWQVIIVILIIVPFFAFRGKEREGFLFVFHPPLCVCVAWTTLTDAVTNSSLAEYFRLRFRLMFQICMHCLRFPGIWMLVPCSRNPTLISKIMGLVTTQDMNLYKMYWPSSLTCYSITVSCVRVCDVWLPRKASKENLKADHPFLHALF